MPTDDRPSQTALTAAAARAAHLLVDSEPFLFSDPLASTMLGEGADDLIGYHRLYGSHLVLANARAMVTTRAGYTEHRLRQAIERGTTQYLLLGAGLDSFAYRSPLAAGITVFEADQAATHRWKIARLAEAGIPVPENVRFLPIDLGSEPLDALLRDVGFSFSRPVFVGWLGVTFYLTRAAVEEVLRVVGTLAPGSEIVLEYMLPDGVRDTDGQAYVEAVAPIAAQQGEPWLTFLHPEEVHALLARHGLAMVEDVGPVEALGSRLWANRQDPLRVTGLSRLAYAAVGSATTASADRPGSQPE
ncbi:SAM-dependent methyltransferase [Frankia sp. CcI49]|uniref:class I SAM-dependent methyltransferase n=1 Tax=Frankia sp. CcI49 TaxID=1745382 RepID=UPI0009757F28|nr:SAM-dependent methyltransferase [Frankia sp. CcI49]